MWQQLSRRRHFPEAPHVTRLKKSETVRIFIIILHAFPKGTVTAFRFELDHILTQEIKSNLNIVMQRLNTFPPRSLLRSCELD